MARRLGVVGIDPFAAAAGYGLVLVSALWLQGLYRLRTRLSIRREVIDVLVAILLLAVVVFTTLYLLKLPERQPALPAPALLVPGSPDARSRGPRSGPSSSGSAHAATTPATCSSSAPTQRPRRSPTRSRATSSSASGRSATWPLRMTRRCPPAWDRRRPVLGTVDEIQDVLHGTVVDEVAICLGLEDWSLVEPITRLCEDEGRIVRIPLTETT